MDEQRPAGPAHMESSTGAPEPALGAATPAWRPAPSAALGTRGRWGSLLGTALALALAFVWGGLAYRELGPRTHALSVAAAGVAVAGSESPPQWVGTFASAFCDGDAKALAERIGPPLSGQVDQIAQALAQRDWTCAKMRYIGGGTNPKGSFFVYLMQDRQSQQQWWVFTVQNEKVVAID